MNAGGLYGCRVFGKNGGGGGESSSQGVNMVLVGRELDGYERYGVWYDYYYFFS